VKIRNVKDKVKFWKELVLVLLWNIEILRVIFLNLKDNLDLEDIKLSSFLKW